MAKRYEVLKGLPTYGQMAISITNNDELFVSEGYVVKFFRDDGSTWIANFSTGYNNLFTIIEFLDSKNLLVIAGGEGYFMNPNSSKPDKEFVYYIEEFVKRENGGFIFATLTDIIFFDEYAEEEWKINISYDGIKDLTIKGNELRGYCYDIFAIDNDDMWVKFMINIDTKELEGGCGDIEIIPEKKPWSRYIWVVGFMLLLYYQLSR